MNYAFFRFHKSHPDLKHHHRLHCNLKIRCQNKHNTMTEEKLGCPLKHIGVDSFTWGSYTQLEFNKSRIKLN